MFFVIIYGIPNNLSIFGNDLTHFTLGGVPPPTNLKQCGN